MANSLADSLGNIFQLLVQLAEIKQRRRREIFEKVMIPINDQFVNVHQQYQKLFRKTIDACPRLQSDGSWVCEQNGKQIVLTNEKDVDSALDELKKNFLEDREALDPNRVDMKSSAARIFSAPIEIEEKRYAWGVLSYLLYPDKQIGPAHFIDAAISSVNRKKVGSLMRTPSSDLYNAIKPMTDADKIQDFIESLEDNLNARRREISELWADLKLTALRKTTPLK